VQREIRFAPPSTPGPGETTARRDVVNTVAAWPANGDSAPGVGQVLSTSALLDRVDEMIGQLEERILEELERRGGRFTGYF
jgi:hypothetical protein